MYASSPVRCYDAVASAGSKPRRSVDVADLVEDPNWDQVPLSGEGRLFIGDGDAQMSKMTSQIAGAFREYKRM